MTIQPGTPDWRQAPPWAQWVALDGHDRTWYWHELRPSTETLWQRWQNPGRKEVAQVGDSGKRRHLWNREVWERPEIMLIHRPRRALSMLNLQSGQGANVMMKVSEYDDPAGTAARMGMRYLNLWIRGEYTTDFSKEF